MKWSLFIALAILIACNNESESVQATGTDTTKTVSDTISGQVVMDSINQQLDTIVNVRFAPDSSSITLEGHLNKKGDPLIFYIPVQKGNKISAIIIPGSPQDNIRISHIQMPDGSTDGPSGQSLDYKLKGAGLYKLYVSPNRMAGDPAAADFRIRIRII